MNCTNCKVSNPDGSEHCFNCGARLGDTAPKIAKPPVRTKHVESERREEAKILASIDIGGTPLIITESYVSFGMMRLNCGEITGIRYGVYKSYVNGIRTSRSYAIWLTDGRSSVEIECATFMTGSSTVEARYRQAINALYPTVMAGLLQSFLLNLESGAAFQVGNVLFDRKGLHHTDSLGSITKGIFGAWASLAGGPSADQREHRYKYMPWSEFTGHGFGDGLIHIYRLPKQQWASFTLRDTWNAVCLGPLFDFLREDNRMYTLMEH